MSIATVWIILQVAIALGMVIFVHELGHFAVAKWCGVKCEKFYLGFDIFGLKLAKFRRGETEYGIGILPLGGYVKMLGQEDNPARMAEELERAKQLQAQRDNVPSTESPPEGTATEDEALFDPRSYLAKSVWKRMAIISAGVVMNVIFAFVVAMIAYGIGVNYLPCIVSRTVPGSAAWQAGIQPGDEIVQIADIVDPRFRDLQSGVVLGDIEDGVTLVIRRPGVEEPLSFDIRPDRDGLVPTIGITGPARLVLADPLPVMPGSVASQAEPAFESGDRVVAVDGTPLETYAEFQAMLAERPAQPLRITVERSEGKAPAKTLDITVEPNRARRLGLVMTGGPITAVQAGSPAAEADLRAGDHILKIDGAEVGDPMTLGARLDARSGETVTFSFDRPGVAEPIEIPVTLRKPQWFDWPPPLPKPGTPMSVASLGIAYDVQPQVEAVLPDSSASRVQLGAGDVIAAAKIRPPESSGETNGAEDGSDELKESDLEFTKDEPDWPVFMSLLQEYPAGATVELTLGDGRTVSLEPAVTDDWFDAERGFFFEPLKRERYVGSIWEAAVLAAGETKNSVLQVYRFLQKLVARQLSPKVLGGPVTIARVAGSSAAQGPSELLIFLCLLSTNLAVINFLPIPLLDGGHMVFLIIEAVRGKPAGERFTIALQYAGFLFILSLMGFVIYLDVLRVFEGWG